MNILKFLGKFKDFGKDEKAFTGLEAAIVLTAFVVVAAVFSYVVLGAGFFTSEKSKEVIHTGMDQATSSVELAGDVIGHKNTSATSDGTNRLGAVTVYIQLTAGNNPVDLSKLTVAYADQYVYNGSLTYTDTGGSPYQSIEANSAGEWDFAFVAGQDGDHGDDDVMLETGEMAQVKIYLPTEAGNGIGGVAINKQLQVELKPASGASLAIEKTVPGAIDTIMVLY
ncbi:MAG: flagellin [Candidatus Methanogaster sp.]|uniref:Flagellin n=1 Tax=Candidatus Methanogaster sp. TaxID=3386292 RepID=A0AC61L4F9_9EURY|nr:MAG: flagellin [ANME-2 cluster archaeon]